MPAEQAPQRQEAGAVHVAAVEPEQDRKREFHRAGKSRRAADADRGIVGIVGIPWHHAVAATTARIESLPKERGNIVFAPIDFGGDAARLSVRRKRAR